MSLETLAIALVIFAASLVQTATGFAFALISMPLISLLAGPKTASPVVAATAVIFSTVVSLRYFREVQWQQLGLMLAGVFAGVPIGVYLLKVLDPIWLQLFIGVTLTLYALNALFRQPEPKLFPNALGPVFGFVSGIINGALNMGGPPVVIYLSGKGLTQRQFVATLQVFFALGGVMVVAGHMQTGILTPAAGRTILWCLPAIGLGALLGGKVLHSAKPEVLRKGTTVMLLVLGVVMLARVSTAFWGR